MSQWRPSRDDRTQRVGRMSDLSAEYAAEPKLSMEFGPGIGPSVSTSVLTYNSNIITLLIRCGRVLLAQAAWTVPGCGCLDGSRASFAAAGATEAFALDRGFRAQFLPGS